MAPPVRKCLHPSCRTLIAFTDSYCERHIKTTNQSYDKTRKPKQVKFYNSPAWRNTRRVALLRDDWLCRHCLSSGKYETAQMVDHIIPTQTNWDKRLDLNNLQSLCHACHNKKTAEDEKKSPASF